MPHPEKIANEFSTIESASVCLKEAYKSILQHSLNNLDDVLDYQRWQELRAVSEDVSQALKLVDHLTAYRRIIEWQPADVPSCISFLKRQTGIFDAMGRVGELLKLATCHVLEISPDFNVTTQSRQVFTKLVEVLTKEGPVDVVSLLSSEQLSFGYKTAWFQKTLIPALRYLRQQDEKENRQEKISPLSAERIESEEDPSSEPTDFRGELTLGMSVPTEMSTREKSNHFTINPGTSGYYRCIVREKWNGHSLSFSKASIVTKPYAPPTKSPDLPMSEIKGRISLGSMIALPMKKDFLPTRVKSTSKDQIPILQTPQNEFVLDGRNLASSGSVEYCVETSRLTNTQYLDKPGALNDFRQYKVSDALEKQIQRWRQESKSIEETAGKILHFIKTSLQYSNDPQVNASYRQGDPAGYFARIEAGKLADCDLANGFYVFLLNKCAIHARLAEGYFVDKTHLVKRTGFLGSHNAHVWTEVWNGQEWLAADATPSSDENDNGGEGDGTGSDGENLKNDLLPEILSEAEIEQIIKQALSKIESGKKEKMAEISEFAKDAGCDLETAKKIIHRLEEARLKTDKRGKLYQSLMRDAWMKLKRDLEKPKRSYRYGRLSEGGDLVDEEEYMMDVMVESRDPGGFAKEVTRERKTQVFDGVDLILVADKSLSMEDKDPKTGTPKKDNQQLLGFLLLDSLHQASLMFARKASIKGNQMDIRFGLITYGAIDPQTKTMVSPQVEKSLSNLWGPKEQFEIYSALESNFGGSTPDYSGLKCARCVLEDIDKHTDRPRRLRLILLLTDGGSDSVTSAQMEQELIREKGYLLRVAGIGYDACAVEKVYKEEGTYLESFENAYPWLTTQVIEAANKIAI